MVAAETPAGWLPPRVIGQVVVVANPVVVGAVAVGSLEVLGVVTEGWVVAPAGPRAERLLVAVVPLGTGASAPVGRPAMVVGWLAVDGLVSWLAVGGGGAGGGSGVRLVVKGGGGGGGATGTVGR